MKKNNLYKLSKGISLALAIEGYVLTLSTNPNLEKIGQNIFYPSVTYCLLTEISEKNLRNSKLEKLTKK